MMSIKNNMTNIKISVIHFHIHNNYLTIQQYNNEYECQYHVFWYNYNNT